MSGANHFVFALCYTHQKLLQQARHAFQDEVAKHLPEVVDPADDLDQNVVALLTEERLAKNTLRIEKLSLFAITPEEGAAACKFKAFLNILYSLAKLLHKTQVSDLSKFIDLIVSLKVDNPQTKLQSPDSITNIWAILSRANIEVFRKMNALWSGMSDTTGVFALSDVYQNWLHLSGDDFIQSNQQIQRLMAVLKLFLVPVHPFLVELEKAMNIAPGGLTDLFGLTQAPESPKAQALSGAEAEPGLVQGAKVLLDIESGRWFETEGDAVSESALVALNRSIKSLHASCLAKIRKDFDSDVVGEFARQDDNGYFLIATKDSLPAKEAKKILNCLWKCGRTLDYLEGSSFQLFAWISCLANFFQLFQYVKEIRFHDLLQEYIERINDLLRTALKDFNPVLAIIVCEIDKFEIDNSLKKGYLADKISLLKICETFIKMSVELGAEVQTTPLYIKQLEAIYAQYKETLMLQSKEASVLFEAFNDEAQLLKTHEYVPLTNIDKHNLNRMLGSLEILRAPEDLKKPYIDELKEAIRAPQTRSKPYPFHVHSALDNFMHLQAGKLFQVACLCTQKTKELDKRALATIAQQAELQINKRDVCEEIIDSRVNRAVLLRQQVALIRIRDYLSGHTWVSYRLGLPTFKLPKGIAAIIEETNGNIPLAKVAETCQRIKQITHQKLYGKSKQISKPLWRDDEVHSIYMQIYIALLKAELNEVEIEVCELGKAVGLKPLYTPQKDDAPPQTMQRQSQAYLIYAYAFFSRYVSDLMDNGHAKEFYHVKPWFKDNILSKNLFDFAASATQEQLDQAIAEMRYTRFLDDENKVKGQIKAILNLSFTLTKFSRSVSQKSVDQMLGALNNAISSYGKEEQGLWGRWSTAAKQAAYAVLCLSHELDQGWRGLLVELSDSVSHFSEESLRVVTGHMNTVYEQTKPCRHELYTLTRGFILSSGLRPDIVAKLQQQRDTVSQTGIHIPLPQVINPVCKYTLFGTQQLAKMEMGRRVLAEDDWSDDTFSQQTHQLIEDVQSFLKYLTRELFEDKVADRIEESLPHEISEDTPQPLREILVYTNLAYHADLLIREVSSDKLIIAKLWGTHSHYNSMSADSGQMQYQVALQTVVRALNAYIRKAMVHIDTLFRCVELNLRQVEAKLYFKQNILDEKFGFGEMKAQYDKLFCLYFPGGIVPPAELEPEEDDTESDNEIERSLLAL